MLYVVFDEAEYFGVGRGVLGGRGHRHLVKQLAVVSVVEVVGLRCRGDRLQAHYVCDRHFHFQLRPSLVAQRAVLRIVATRTAQQLSLVAELKALVGGFCRAFVSAGQTDRRPFTRTFGALRNFYFFK